MPTAPDTLCLGNSSRTIPKDSGNTPPPMPWMIRATIITWTFVASAANREPTESATRARTKTFSLPWMSPMRPMIGVKVDAESRYGQHPGDRLLGGVQIHRNGAEHRGHQRLQQCIGGNTGCQYREGDLMRGTTIYGRHDLLS